MSTRIIDSVNFEKLVHKIMSIIYYAVRTNDVTDKNINILIDLCFDLMLPLIVWSPDTLIPVFYRFHSTESFIVSSLRFRGDECIRKSISKAFRLICNNFCVNSKHAKVNRRPSCLGGVQVRPDRQASSGERTSQDPRRRVQASSKVRRCSSCFIRRPKGLLLKGFAQKLANRVE